MGQQVQRLVGEGRWSYVLNEKMPVTNHTSPIVSNSARVAVMQSAVPDPYETPAISTSTTTIRSVCGREVTELRCPGDSTETKGSKNTESLVEPEATPTASAVPVQAFDTARSKREEEELQREREEAEEKHREMMRGQSQERELDEVVHALVALRRLYKNTDPKGLATCLQTLRTYISNLAKSPKEPKFQRINCENNAFRNRVAPYEGALAVLKACGFAEANGALVVQEAFIKSKGSRLFDALAKVDVMLDQIKASV